MSLATAPQQSTERLDERASVEELGVLAAAGAALVAGGIHLAVAPEHWTVSPASSVFFVVLGLGQWGLAVALRWRQPPWVLAAAVLAHLGVIALYVASRTVELPFVAPHDVGHEISHLPVAGGVGNGIPIYPGSRIEPVGLLDLACLAAELVLVAALVAMLPRRWRSLSTTVMVLLGAAAVGVRVYGAFA